MALERLGRLVYPAQCLTCEEMIEVPRGLCPSCWSQTRFIVDTPCDSCGRELVGEARVGDLCESCHSARPPWKQGRAAVQYEGNGRNLVLKLKHGDRTDLARTAGEWMADAARDIVEPDFIVAPVPLHWFRQLRRRYNQAALLSSRISKELALSHVPDLLKRPTSTRSLDGMNAEQRRDIVAGNIVLSRRHKQTISGQRVLLVDDVMTTGSTLRQATSVLLEDGAKEVAVVVMARVASSR